MKRQSVFASFAKFCLIIIHKSLCNIILLPFFIIIDIDIKQSV